VAGYKRNRKIYKLVFDESTDYPGLEVQVRTLSLGQLLDARSRADDEDGTKRMVDLFAERLISWNLEDEADQPVPATLDGIRDQDDDLILALIARWQEAMRGVPAPLDGASPSGETTAAESRLAELPSESLAS
jgi:hypothetical protein